MPTGRNADRAECRPQLLILGWNADSKREQESNHTNAWFPPFRCRSALAALPFPLHKFGKNYISSVTIMPSFHHSVAVLPLLFRRCRYVNSVRIP